jgi:hypothetical protein
MRIFFGHHQLIAVAYLAPGFSALQLGQVSRIFHVDNNVAEDLLVEFHAKDLRGE